MARYIRAPTDEAREPSFHAVRIFMHAWVGMRNIFMDYVKDISVRLNTLCRDYRLAVGLHRLGDTDLVER